MSTPTEIPGDFYDLEYFISMEWRYLSQAHQNKVDIFKKILGNVKEKSILDLGCGGGFFSHLAAQSGAKVVGVDYSPAAIVFSKDRYPGLDFRHADATTLKEFASESFDVVLLIDVIEHIFDQEIVLAEIYRLLKPGGRIIISTDADDSAWGRGFFSRLIWNSYRFSSEGRAYRLIKKVELERRKRKNYHNSHVSLRSREELERLLSQTGYTSISSMIYPLVRVPLRDLFLSFLPSQYRGDHMFIHAKKD